MSWSVWQIDRAGRLERVGAYPTGADARRVLRASIIRGAAVDPDGEVSEARGVAPEQIAAIEATAWGWIATATTPTAPAPAEVIEIPAPVEEVVEPVGVGAATEAPRGMSQTAIDAIREQYAHDCALPDAPVDADLEHLRVQLADATARAAAAEEATARMQAVLDALDATTAERAEAERAELAAALRERSAQLDTALAAVALRQADCDARDLRVAALVEDRDRLAAALNTVWVQLDAARDDLRGRDRTIANLRAELAGIEAHPVVRITAPRVRRVVRTETPVETPVETLHRRLAEIAEGRR